MLHPFIITSKGKFAIGKEEAWNKLLSTISKAMSSWKLAPQKFIPAPEAFVDLIKSSSNDIFGCMQHPFVISSRGKLEQETFISRFIKTIKGRSLLAQAMAMPLRRNLDYQSVIRKTFIIEPLPEGTLPFYSKIEEDKE